MLMLRLSKMINNTYKEFQARTSEKIADFSTKSIQKRSDAVNRYFKISDAKTLLCKVPKALFEENINLFQQMPKCCSDFLLDKMSLSITILSYPKFIITSIRHLIYEYPFQIFAFTGYSFL